MHKSRRGAFRVIAMALVAFVVPIVIIVGGYLALRERIPGDGEQITPAPPPEVTPPPPDSPVPPNPPVAPRQPTPRTGPHDPPYPSPAAVKPYPGDLGDFYMQAPTEPVERGQEITIPLFANCGEDLLAATELHVHYDPLVLLYLGVDGGLAENSRQPFVSNLVNPGHLVIADINTPHKTGEEVHYNEKMSGVAQVYTLRFRVLDEAEAGSASMIGGGSTNFHAVDRKDATVPPHPIGKAPFPRIMAANVGEVKVK